MEKKSVIEIYKVVILTIIAILLVVITFKIVTPKETISSIFENLKKENESNDSIYNLDAVIADLNNLSALAHQYYMKPLDMGGGGNSFLNFEIPANLSSTDNGTYTITAISDTAITFQGLGSLTNANGNTNTAIIIVKIPPLNDSVAVINP